MTVRPLYKTFNFFSKGLRCFIVAIFCNIYRVARRIIITAYAQSRGVSLTKLFTTLIDKDMQENGFIFDDTPEK